MSQNPATVRDDAISPTGATALGAVREAKP
jgi:hypothetical protein